MSAIMADPAWATQVTVVMAILLAGVIVIGGGRNPPAGGRLPG